MPATFSTSTDETFVALYEEHASGLHTYALRLTGSPDDAADALQEVFTAVLGRLRDGAALEHPRAYLFAAVRHAALKRLQDPARTTLVDEVPEDAAAPSAVGRGETEALTKDLRAEVRAAHAELPARQREALVLREVQGLSYGEIGDVLSLTPNAVAQLTWRARLNLRGEVRRRTLRGITPAARACEQALTWLELGADGALTADDAVRLEEHLDRCDRCVASRTAMLELGTLYRAALPVAALPLAAEAVLGRARDALLLHGAVAPAPSGGGNGLPSVPPAVVAVLASLAVAGGAFAAGIGPLGGGGTERANAAAPSTVAVVPAASASAAPAAAPTPTRSAPPVARVRVTTPASLRLTPAVAAVIARPAAPVAAEAAAPSAVEPTAPEPVAAAPAPDAEPPLAAVEEQAPSPAPAVPVPAVPADAAAPVVEATPPVVVETPAPVAEPPVETVVAPVAEPVAAPVVEPVAAPVVEPVAEPVVEAPPVADAPCVPKGNNGQGQGGGACKPA